MEIRTNRDPVIYDKAPDVCPLCLRSAHMILASDQGVVSPPDLHYFQTKLQIFFRCPSDKCGSAFIGEYQSQKNNHNFRSFRFDIAYPLSPAPYNLSAGIAEISPSFVRIANQAQRAESEKLDEIAGIGFRKSLEFLIKDYSVSQHPDQKEKIERASLSACIRDYVADTNVKKCADRAAWLGNDEAHYLRKWSGRDIQDLKKLIDLTMHWISNEHLTKEYLNSMPSA